MQQAKEDQGRQEASAKPGIDPLEQAAIDAVTEYTRAVIAEVIADKHNAAVRRRRLLGSGPYQQLLPPFPVNDPELARLITDDKPHKVLDKEQP